jgi:hypothetical protein
VETGVRPTTRLKGAAPALVGGGDRQLLHNLLLDLVSSLTTFFVLSGSSNGDSSGSSSRSYSSRSFGGDSRYSDRNARRFKEECDATRHELEIISKQAGIAELEWQHQRKQLLEIIDGESRNLLNFNLTLN